MNRQFLSLTTLDSVREPDLQHLNALKIHNLGDLVAYPPVRHARFVRAAADGLLNVAEVRPYLNAAQHEKSAEELLQESPKVLKDVGGPSAESLGKLGVDTVAALAEFPPFVEAEQIITRGVEEMDPQAPACVLPKCRKFTRNSKSFASFFRQREVRKLSILHDNPSSSIASLFHFESEDCRVLYLGYSVSYLQEWVYTGVHLGEPLGSVSLLMGQDTQVSMLDWRRVNQALRTEDTTVGERLLHVLQHQRAVDEVARATAEEHQYGATSTFGVNAATAGSFVAAGGLVGGIGGGMSGALAGFVIGNVANAAAGAPTLAGAAIGTAVGSVAGAAAGSLLYSGATTLGFVETDAQGDRSIVGRSAQNILQRTVQNSSSLRSFWSNIVTQSIQREDQRVETSRVTNHNRIHALNALYFEVLNEYRIQISVNDFSPILFLPFKPLQFTEDILRRYWWILRAHLGDENLVNVLDEHFATLTSVPSPAEHLDALPQIESVRTSLVEIELNLDGSAMQDLLDGLLADMVGVLFSLGELIENFYQSLKRNLIRVSVITSQGDFALARSQSPNSNPNFIGKYSTDAAIPVQSIQKIKIINDNTELTLFGVIDVNELVFEEVKARIQVKHRSTLEPLLPNIGALEPKRTIATGVTVQANREKSIDWDIATRLRNQFEGINAEAEVLSEAAAEEELVQTRINNLLGFLNANKYGFTRLILQTVEREQMTCALEAVEIGGVPLSEIAGTTPIGFCGNHAVLPLKKPATTPASADLSVETEKLQLALVHAYAATAPQGLIAFLEPFIVQMQSNTTLTSRDRDLLKHLRALLGQAKKVAASGASAIESLELGRLRTIISSTLAFIQKPVQAAPEAVAALGTYYDEVYKDLTGGLGKIVSASEVSLPTPAVFMEPVLSHSKGAELYDMLRNSHYDILPAPGIGAVDPNVLRAQPTTLTPTVPQATLAIQQAPVYPLPSALSTVLGEVGKLDLSTLIAKNTESLNNTITGLAGIATELAKAAATLSGDAQKQALSTAGDVAKQITDVVRSSLQSGAAAMPAMAAPAESTPTPRPPETQQEKAEVERRMKEIDSGSGTAEQKAERKRSVGGSVPAARSGRRDLNVRLVFESGYGIPIPYDAMAGMRKLFRLWHEEDVREVELGSLNEVFNPLYALRLQEYNAPNGEVFVELDYGEGSYKGWATDVKIPANDSTMIVRAKIATTEITITRTQSESRTQALAEKLQTTFGYSASASAKLAQILEIGAEASGEVTASTTETDTTGNTESQVITEKVLVPTGNLELTVTFTS